jgi:hypothetical protein
MKVYDTKPGKRQKRMNVIEAFWAKKSISQCKVMNTRRQLLFFEDWFEFDLISLLPECAVVIMDNASFHRKKQLREIARRYNIFVLFFLPYSPEFNPVEHSPANFKRWLCDNSRRFSCFDFAIQTCFTYHHY